MVMVPTLLSKYLVERNHDAKTVNYRYFWTVVTVLSLSTRYISSRQPPKARCMTLDGSGWRSPLCFVIYTCTCTCTCACLRRLAVSCGAVVLRCRVTSPQERTHLPSRRSAARAARTEPRSRPKGGAAQRFESRHGVLGERVDRGSGGGLRRGLGDAHPARTQAGTAVWKRGGEGARISE